MVAAAPSAPAAFELKSTALTLVAVVLKTTDVAALAVAMEARFGDAPGLFDGDPVAVDLSLVQDAAEPIDFVALTALLRRHRMLPVAAKAGNAAQMEAALAAGLTEAHSQAPRPDASGRTVAAAPLLEPEPGTAADTPMTATPAESATAAAATTTAASTATAPSTAAVASTASTAAAAASPVEAHVEGPAPAQQRTALIVDKPLRSGQRVYARGADLIVLAVVSYGAEVIADGNIHVYAPLRGRALAGALGDTAARIFTTCMEPQLLSIAGIYRTTETELAADVLGKPATVRLDGEKLIVEAMNY